MFIYKIKSLVLFVIVFIFASFSSLYSMSFKQINTIDGLIHPTVLVVSQDSLGRIWFGTANGLSIYDGNGIISYKPFQKKDGKIIFSGPKVFDIVSDKEGNVYFRTSKELIKYDIRHESFNTIYENRINTLYSHNGKIFFTVDNKLFCLDTDLGKYDYVTELPHEDIYKIIIDKKERVWLLGSDKVYVNENNCIKEVLSVPCTYIYESLSEEIWIATRLNGIVKIDKRGNIYHYNKENYNNRGLNTNFIRCIEEDKLGNIWFGTITGLYKYVPGMDSFIFYQKNDKNGSLSNSSVYSLFYDKTDCLWVGTYSGGVNYADLSRNIFKYIPSSEMKNTLSHPMVGDMTEDKDGNIWICTEGGGLNMLNPKTDDITYFKSSVYPYFLPYTNLKCIYYDNKKHGLYIGSHTRGMSYYDIDNRIFKNKFGNTISSDPSNIISAIVPAGSKILFSTPKKVFDYDLHDGKVAFLTRFDLSDFSSCITSYRDNLLYSWKDSIYVYDTQKKEITERYLQNNRNRYNGVFRLFVSKDGDLYMCTSGNGIMKLNRKNGVFEEFPLERSSILNDLCYRIVETSDGKIISSGNKGLAVFSKEGTLIRFFKLGKSLPLSSIIRDCGLYVAKNGNIYVGGTNGLVYFHESDIRPQEGNSELYFSELYLGNKKLEIDSASILRVSLPFAESIEVPYNHERIDFKFSSKDNIINLNNNVYEYRLFGFETNWAQTNQSVITYTNLPAGNYTLELRVKTDDFGRNDLCRLDIVVLSPWYFTWWAFLLYLCIIIVVAFLIVRTIFNRRRVKEMIRMEKMEKEKIKEITEAKLRFFTSVSHEFRTPLTLIAGNIQQILQSHYLPPLLCNKMMKIMRQSEQLNELVTELIEFRKYEQNLVELNVSPCNLNVFLEEIYQSFNIIATQNKVNFYYERCLDDICIYLDKKQIKKVVYNLLSNAFKYTLENGEIYLKVYMANEEFVNISVSDSGVGIPEKDLPYVFVRFYRADNEMTQISNVPGTGIGLALAKDIVALHGGQISVSSKIGEGSSFTVSLRIGKDFFIGKQNVVLKEDDDNGMDIITEEISSGNVYITDTNTEDGGIGDVVLNDKEKPLVLIVDDNKEILDMLWNIFSPFYQVVMAENGQIGYEKVKEHKPDIVVSDVMMPIMNGYDLCKKIKENMDYCHIFVVLLTALNMPEHNLEGLLHGADDYIGKPFNTQLLLAKCNNLIRSRRLIYQQLTKQVNDNVSLLATNNSDKEFLEKVQSTIEKRLLEEDFTVDSLASDMCMGRTSFYNKFKKLTGVTPNEYVNTYRLKLASVWLLNNDNKSIADIATQLQFGSYNYFCRKFKECFGMSPTQYKKEHS